MADMVQPFEPSNELYSSFMPEEAEALDLPDDSGGTPGQGAAGPLPEEPKAKKLNPVQFAQALRRAEPGAYDSIKSDYTLAQAAIMDDPSLADIVDFGTQVPQTAPLSTERVYDTMGEAIVDTAARPGQWFQSKMSDLGEETQKIVERVKANMPPEVVEYAERRSPLGRAMGLSAQADEAAEDYKSSVDKKLVSGKLSESETRRLSNRREAVDMAQFFNPVPRNTSEALLGGAMAGAMEIPGGLGKRLSNLTPEVVEGKFTKLGEIIPNAAKGFEEANALKAATKRTETDLTNLNTQIKEGEESKRLHHDKRMAAQKALTGSESVVPQLLPEEVGNRISAALSYETNPYSEGGKALAPISAMRGRLMGTVDPSSGKRIPGSLSKHEIPVNSVTTQLGQVKADLLGLVNTPGENSVRTILAPYLKLPEWVNEQTIDASGKSEFTSQSYKISVATALSDAEALGRLAKSKESSSPTAARALKEAQDIIRKSVTKNLPEKLGKAVIQNTRDFGEWYKKYDNEHTRSIRNRNPSQMYDPIFDSVESVNAFKDAVSPEDWDYVRSNKINEVVGKVINAPEGKAGAYGDGPWGAYNTLNKAGYLDQFMTPGEKARFERIVSNKHDVDVLKADLEGLRKQKEAIEDSTRRKDDTVVKQRKDDKSEFTRNILASATGIGALGILVGAFPVLSGVVAAVGAVGVTPEMIGRLYLKSPEVRSRILDAGMAKSYTESIKHAAQLSSFLETKQREIESYKNQTGENRKKMPEDLRKYEREADKP